VPRAEEYPHAGTVTVGDLGPLPADSALARPGGPGTPANRKSSRRPLTVIRAPAGLDVVIRCAHSAYERRDRILRRGYDFSPALPDRVTARSGPLAAHRIVA